MELGSISLITYRQSPTISLCTTPNLLSITFVFRCVTERANTICPPSRSCTHGTFGVSHDGVHAVGIHRCHNVPAIACQDGHCPMTPCSHSMVAVGNSGYPPPPSIITSVSAQTSASMRSGLNMPGTQPAIWSSSAGNVPTW
jgi:hypothetical protein